jgi:hypothetical protein
VQHHPVHVGSCMFVACLHARVRRVTWEFQCLQTLDYSCKSGLAGLTRPLG